MPDASTVVSIACPVSFILWIAYIVSFSTPVWVVTDTSYWGLWRWCYDEDFYSDTQDNNTSRCHDIEAGQSPAYYEVVRCFATVTLVLFIFPIFVCCGWGKKRDHSDRCDLRAVVIMLNSVCAAITLMVIGLLYEKDDRWKDKNPSLGWCFWLAAASAILNFPVLCCICLYDMRETNRSSSQRGVTLPRCPPPRRLSNASSISIDSKKKMTIFRQEVFATQASVDPERPGLQDSSDPPGTFFVGRLEDSGVFYIHSATNAPRNTRMALARSPPLYSRRDMVIPPANSYGFQFEDPRAGGTHDVLSAAHNRYVFRYEQSGERGLDVGRQYDQRRHLELPVLNLPRPRT